MRKLTILSAFVVVLSGANAFAGAEGGDADQARQVVQSLADQTVAAAKIEDKEARRRALLDAAAPAVDFRAIGVGVLGHAGVKVPGDRQSEVTEGVIAFVSRQVIGEIERVRPEEAKLGEVKPGSGDELRVNLKLAGLKDKIDADWVMKKQADGWRATDVMVAGNSLVVHFGGQLARKARGELDQLVEFLRTEQKRDSLASLPQ